MSSTKLFFFLIILFSTSFSNAIDLCEGKKGYVVGFFNGVGNTMIQAQAGQAGLRKEMIEFSIINQISGGKTVTFEEINQPAEPVSFESFYNSTGSENGSSTLEDLAEVFEQRVLELQQGTISQAPGRWELFWRYGRAGLLSSIPGIGLLSDWVERVSDEEKNAIVARLGNLIENPPTGVDTAIQHTRLKSLALEGKKLLLIAHSQGNLFVNLAYDATLTVDNYESENISVVHIAPASPTIRGGYSLSDKDVIINGLRVFGFDTIQPNNIVLPFRTEEPSGHFLIETYLNPGNSSLVQIADLMRNSFDSLVDPITDVSEGFFTVTMTWNGSGDVDLHTFEPQGDHVYYANKVGSAGRLDVDNTVGVGPEHYFASCDSEQLQTGAYRFGINNYAGATGRKAILQVSTPFEGELYTTEPRVDVGEELGSEGDDAPIPVFSVIVENDAEGNPQVRVQN